MAARDYKKLYNELKATYENCSEQYVLLVKEHTHLMDRYGNLDKEFTKAVNANKNQQMMIFEQRGIIGFLENKIEKLRENLDDA